MRPTTRPSRPICLAASLLAPVVLSVGLLPVQEPAPQDDPLREEVSYTNDVRPLMESFCTTCHAGDDPSGGFVLTSYETVREQTEDGVLLERIEDADDPMPQSGLLPSHLRRVLHKWADGGYVHEGRRSEAGARDFGTFEPPTIVPVDVRKEGLGFLESMQGHWVGRMELMGQEIPWFAFDYRAIGPSIVHGIFEGGTMGNLFTTFFVADVQGTRTILARNGGILNGIYRTSYFVLDRVERDDDERRYRFVDAYGGEGIMSMQVIFRGDRIEFTSHTSRMGLLTPPTRHMHFTGRRTQPELARAAARAVGFPKNEPAFRFPDGVPVPNWGTDFPVTSASFVHEDRTKSVLELAHLAKDPIRIDQVPHVGELTVTVERGAAARGKPLLVLLSSRALTDADGKLRSRFGFLREDLGATILSFPQIHGRQDAFTFTYLHPGTYHVTVVADVDGDGYPGTGDVTHPARTVTVAPGANAAITIEGLDVVNR